MGVIFEAEPSRSYSCVHHRNHRRALRRPTTRPPPPTTAHADLLTPQVAVTIVQAGPRHQMDEDLNVLSSLNIAAVGLSQ